MICGDCKYRNQDESAWPCKNCTPDDRRFEAAPDPRDEVIRLLKEKFEHIREYWNGDTNHAAMVDALNHIDDVAFEALAAIDKVMKEVK